MPEGYYLNTMNVILKGTVNNGHFRDRWKEWVQQYLALDFDNADPLSLMALLVADGMWFSDILGIYPISSLQKQKILQLINSLQIME
ncbi:hypothetical protein D3C87_2057740 [compost metagenome]